MSAGKGSRRRDVDRKKFDDNYDKSLVRRKTIKIVRNSADTH